jgi:hypothetical protein
MDGIEAKDLTTARSGQLRRRGVMTGVAALVAGVLARLAEPDRAHAADGGNFILGSSINNATQVTRLFKNSSEANFQNGLDVENRDSNSSAIFGSSKGEGSAVGIIGISSPSPFGTSGHVGVWGISGANTGFPPAPLDRIGVLGQSALSLAVGVQGHAPLGNGVVGQSTSGHGVFGQTSPPAGTVVPPGNNPGGGMLAAGVAGRSNTTIALYGYTDGPPNPNYAPIGAVGQCDQGFGVWGLSSAGPGATSRPGGGSPTAISGVLGTSASGLGVYAISSGAYALAADGNGPSTVGALLRGLGGGKAAVCVGDVEIQGHLTVTGGVNGPLSAQAAVEDFGEGQLTAGRAEVRLDPAVAAALPDDRYLVFLTENDDHHALYVTRRTRQGFEVRAKDAPTASGTFSYRVVARVRGAPAAGERAPAPLHVPTLPVPQGVPTLPVGRERPAAPTRKPDER